MELFFLDAIGRVDAEFDVLAIDAEELLVFLRIVLHDRFELIDDLLLDVIGDLAHRGGLLKDLTGDTVIKAVRAPQEKLTEEQKDRIGEFPSYEITIVNNGVEINELSGTITAWFAYDAPNGTAGMHVYLVSSDGSTEELPFTYDNGIVTFRTSHLSIYCVSQDDEIGGGDSNDLLLPIIIASVIAAAVLVTALAVRSKKKKRRCEQ